MSPLDAFAAKHAVIRTATTSFVMAYLPVNQSWATWREERGGYQALLGLHPSKQEAEARLEQMVAFQLEVEATP